MARFLPALLAPIVFAPLFFVVSYSGRYRPDRPGAAAVASLPRARQIRTAASVPGVAPATAKEAPPAQEKSYQDRRIEAMLQAYLKPRRFGPNPRVD